MAGNENQIVYEYVQAIQHRQFSKASGIWACNPDLHGEMAKAYLALDKQEEEHGC